MSHYYQQDGTPHHFMPNASKPGETRPTTIRDAKKLNLFPSVTTVIAMLDKGTTLADWKQRQALYSALCEGRFPECAHNGDGSISEKDPAFLDWAKRCMEDARRQVAVKAERGTILHDAMMRAHHDYDSIEPQYLAHVDGMFAELERRFGKRYWIAEGNFAHPDGFAGQIDLRTVPGDPDPIILDYKFKEFDESKQASYFVYDEHRIQLGAYSRGVGMEDARLFNAFGSVSRPGLVLVHEHKPADAEYGRRMFAALLQLHEVKTGYKPKWE